MGVGSGVSSGFMGGSVSMGSSVGMSSVSLSFTYDTVGMTSLTFSARAVKAVSQGVNSMAVITVIAKNLFFIVFNPFPWTNVLFTYLL